jgi:hypothetical protein
LARKTLGEHRVDGHGHLEMLIERLQLRKIECFDVFEDSLLRVLRKMFQVPSDKAKQCAALENAHWLVVSDRRRAHDQATGTTPGFRRQ